MAKEVPANFHALYDRGFRAARGIQPKAPPQGGTAGHTRLGSGAVWSLHVFGNYSRGIFDC
jgi:hypothetical protein